MTQSKYVVLILSLLITSSVFSQNVAKLDEKYGFKTFKLSASPSLYKIERSSLEDSNPNITEYNYTGTDLNYLYTVKTRGTTLTFYKNKLMSIQVFFPDNFSESDYNIILYSLEKLFGIGNNCVVNDPTYTNYSGKKWVGKKVEMEILRLYSNKNMKWGGYLLISEKNLQNQRIEDEF